MRDVRHALVAPRLLQVVESVAEALGLGGGRIDSMFLLQKTAAQAGQSRGLSLHESTLCVWICCVSCCALPRLERLQPL